MKRLYNRAFKSFFCYRNVASESAIGLYRVSKRSYPIANNATGLLKQQAYKEPKTLKDFVQVNLVASNSNYGAAY